MAGQLPHVLVISGVSSGVGKTSIAIGIMASLTHRGMRVQPFKVGPDFLDPMHHSLACGGIPSVNLDGAMMGRDGVLESFSRNCRASEADIAIVEGCMGLFDGRDGHSDCGSTAEIAKWLHAPVVLVVDAWCLGRTAAAIVHGYASFDPDIRLAGVILNKIGGESHAQWLRDAISSSVLTKGVLVLGCLPKSVAVVMPERHLGLHLPSSETHTTIQHHIRLLIDAHVDLDTLVSRMEDADSAVRAPTSALSLPVLPDTLNRDLSRLPPVRFGVAKDDAFCFYYHDNLRHLEAAGATIVFFSPLHDTTLPSGLHGIYLGGGYPELHGSILEANKSMRASVHAFASGGGLVYAECGGLMYLANTLHDGHEGSFAMAGLLPFDVTMTPRMVMGYINASPSPALASLLRLPINLVLKCQQFHFSEATNDVGKPVEQLGPTGVGIGWTGVAHPAFHTTIVRSSSHTPQSSPEGIVQASTIATYCHVHFGATPEMAPALVAAARRHMRYVSFEATATETLGAIWTTKDDEDGYTTNPSVLRGISEFCTSPAWLVRSLPKLTLSLITATTSQEIERQVQELHATGLRDLHTIDTVSLQMSKPDVVFTQEACDRCAVTDSALLRALDAVGLADVTSTVLCRPLTVNDMLSQVLRLAAVVGESRRGCILHAALTRRLQVVRDLIDAENPTKPRVLGLESAFPLVVSGQWLPDMRLRAGGVEALNESYPGCPPRRLQWDEIVAASPEVLVVACCGKSATGSAKEVEEHLAILPGFWDLPAMQTSPPRLYVVDHDLSSRPGPQLVDGIEILAALLHPTIEFPCQSLHKVVLQFVGPQRCLNMAEYFVPVNIKVGTKIDATQLETLEPSPIATSPRTLSPIQSLPAPTIATSQAPPSGAFPLAVSAHVLLSWNHKLLLLSGDTSPLDDATNLWEADVSLANDGAPSSLLVWRPAPCTAVYGEAVPTRRSNHAAVVWGDILVAFGGWDACGLHPLADLELLDLTTRCWTHGSTVGRPPSPRGNPSMVLASNRVLLVFGGWNGRDRFNDVVQLDLTSWSWSTLSAHDELHPASPSPRTDHTAIWWPSHSKNEHDRSGDDIMVVFGGSDKHQGPLNDVWAYDPSRAGTVDAWEQWICTGEVPPPRTSHAAILADSHEIEDMDDEDDNDDLASERYRLLHRVACARGYRQYVDPGSGYTVFTALYLKDRACCGYKCRHCPWGHKNVKKGVKNPNPNLEW
ncbi:hypothetical protein DYB36_009441 [Aphanomyces astaci]|uniref:Uncharacterized protein n=1 Tax=Aphanomyces astaci TaxID=112090 RepID=A0A397BDH8_APHAT|nr:hypothetical protein DYB36_009441 [Aphanomyces astaci]